jgi:hypothetical protein
MGAYNKAKTLRSCRGTILNIRKDAFVLEDDRAPTSIWILDRFLTTKIGITNSCNKLKIVAAFVDSRIG